MIYCWPTIVMRAAQIVRTAHHHTHGIIRRGWHAVSHGLTVKGALVATTVLVCVSIPPPGESQPPPIPTIVTPPGPPGEYPPPWAFVPPPEDTYVPGIPVGFVPGLGTPEGPQEAIGAPALDIAQPSVVVSLLPLCPPETPPASRPVDEPRTLAWFAGASVLLLIWRMLKYER
jgi:hypothetical protein